MKIIFLLLFNLTFLCLHAQQAVLPSGGDSSGSGGSINYSVGQTFYTISNGTSGSLIQGVQQPFEISETTFTNDAVGITLQMKAYPNPVISNLTLSIEDIDFKSISYQIYDMSGKLLKTMKVDSKETDISFYEYAAATYFIKIIQENKENKEIKTFKIIKSL